MIRKQTPVYLTPMFSVVINMIVPTADREIGPIYESGLGRCRRKITYNMPDRVFELS
jgi:hypothetical protein